MIRPLAMVAAAMLVFGVSCSSGDSLPGDLHAGRNIYADHCSTCHGNRGQGGVGPSLSNVLTVWPSCDDQQRWISMGSEEWKAEFGPTYGATGEPITDVMPRWAELLTEHEIATVAAFERVEYGGGDADVVLADCGLPVPQD